MGAAVDRRVDLHTHTNFSDGRLDPEELVEEAVWHGLSALALTDHDNVEGLERFQAACRQKGVEGVDGVELSCEHEGREVHIVGLFIKPSEAFCALLDSVKRERELRMEKMLSRLSEIGIEIPMEEVPQEAGRSFGRPHLARALVERGVVRNVGEAFARYLGDQGPAYVAKSRFAVRMGIDLVHEIGGISVLAHPGASGLVDRIPDFAALGVMAVEAPYPKHTPEEERKVRALCAQHGLLVSGGSDFHGNGDGRDLGQPPIGYAVLEALKERLAEVRKGT